MYYKFLRIPSILAVATSAQKASFIYNSSIFFSKGPMPTAVTLYRRILKLHQLLPFAPKALGDQYVKDEFRKHKNVNALQAQQFLNEWKVQIKQKIHSVINN